MKSLLNLLFNTILCCFFAQAQDNTLTGVVFHDENKDGICNNNEQKLEGVFVSYQ